jgi:hypothetical protein
VSKDVRKIVRANPALLIEEGTSHQQVLRKLGECHDGVLVQDATGTPC